MGHCADLFDFGFAEETPHQKPSLCRLIAKAGEHGRGNHEQGTCRGAHDSGRNIAELGSPEHLFAQFFCDFSSLGVGLCRHCVFRIEILPVEHLTFRIGKHHEMNLLIKKGFIHEIVGDEIAVTVNHKLIGVIPEGPIGGEGAQFFQGTVQLTGHALHLHLRILALHGRKLPGHKCFRGEKDGAHEHKNGRKHKRCRFGGDTTGRRTRLGHP